MALSVPARWLLALAAVSLAQATALGAYASHGLDAVLDARTLGAVHTAIDYQFYHSLGLLFLGLAIERRPSGALLLSAWLLIAGILLFCGGIYAGALGAPAWLGMITPLGGLCFIAAWLVCAFAVWRLGASVLR